MDCVVALPHTVVVTLRFVTVGAVLPFLPFYVAVSLHFAACVAVDFGLQLVGLRCMPWLPLVVRCPFATLVALHCIRTLRYVYVVGYGCGCVTFPLLLVTFTLRYDLIYLRLRLRIYIARYVYGFTFVTFTLRLHARLPLRSFTVAFTFTLLPHVRLRLRLVAVVDFVPRCVDCGCVDLRILRSLVAYVIYAVTFVLVGYYVVGCCCYVVVTDVALVRLLVTLPFDFVRTLRYVYVTLPHGFSLRYIADVTLRLLICAFAFATFCHTTLR